MKQAERDERAATARRNAKDLEEQRRQAMQVRNHEQALKRAARLAAKQVAEEAEKLRTESKTELQQRRSEAALCRDGR